MESIVSQLGDEYELETGFIGRLRDERIFDSEKAERYLSLLSSLEIGDSISLDLAKLIWHLPVMLQWQLERAEEGSEISRQIEATLNSTVNILTDVIGVP